MYPIAIALSPTANVSVPKAIWFSPIFLRSCSVRAFSKLSFLVSAFFKSVVNLFISSLTLWYSLAKIISLSVGLSPS